MKHTSLKSIHLTIIMATILSRQRMVLQSPIFVHAFSTLRTETKRYAGNNRCTSKEVYLQNKSLIHNRVGCSQALKLNDCRYRQSRILSSKTPDQAEREITLETLPEELRMSFLRGETDGIMKLSPSLVNSFSGEDIIVSAMEAARNSKGQAASILNAIIASCSQDGMNGNDDAPALAWDIYSTWEELAEEIELFPDIVTFCCTYSSVLRATEDEDFFQDCAKQVLERVQRYSKKIAGSKRRKMLNSISRRGGKGKNDVFRAMDHLEQMQESYGQDFDILYEDDDVIVVNKPSGMVVFHSRKTTDGKIGRKKKARVSKKKKKNGGNDGEVGDAVAGYSDISLEDALIDIGLSLSTLNPDALGIVHRIDRGTSGCIVLAKNDDAHARLVTAFFTRSAKKQYAAIVPYQASLQADQDLESSGVIELEVGGRPAKSIYRIEREFGKSALQLDIETQTGRKHQVRIHCSKGLGRAIFLDPLYSEMGPKAESKKRPKAEGDKQNNDAGVINIIDSVSDPDGRRFFLHASTLSIKEFGIDVNACLPSWWLPILDDLEKLI